MPSTSLRSRLDHDVYHAVVKLTRENDDKPFERVSDAYDALKRCNSSLSRQKKIPLQDSLDRVLRVLKQERVQDGNDADNDIDIDIDIDTPETNADERFLLNRQMTRHWNVEPATLPTTAAPTRVRTNGHQPTKKKRKATPDSDDEAITAVGTPKEPNDMDSKTADSLKTQKKSSRMARFTVEENIACRRLGGLGYMYPNLVAQVRDFLLQPEFFGKLNWERVPGIILSGPPGTGKRSIIRALASDLCVAVINLTWCFEEPERMEKSLMEAFDAALAAAPCIVYIEDVDRHMGRPVESSNHEHQQRSLSIFRRQMERITSQHARVLAMATTSRPTDVNPAILSCDLLEQMVHLRVPDKDARHAILEILTDGVTLSPEVDLADLAKMTHGFVGADIVLLVRQVNALASRRVGILKEPDSIWGLYPSSIPLKKLIVPSPALLDEPEEIILPDSIPIILDDFKLALKNFVPSLRKEGFNAIPDIKWDQVGALSAVREQLHMSIIGPIRRPELYQSFGISLPAGCLLWGPPGCGKTLVAQAVANEAQASFILINGPELLNKYVGESERAVRELFQRARSSTPCILFFDEIDSLVPRRDNASTESGARVVNALLSELDGAQDRTGIYVMGTTNRPDMIDEAMLRPGRLSVRLFVDLPTRDERVDILKTIYRTRHADCSAAESELLSTVALDSRCEGFSGADLGGLHTKAAECALKRFLKSGAELGPSTGIGLEDWDMALSKTTPSVSNPEMYRKLNIKL